MPDLKQQIDSMTYEQLLHRWRFAPVGDLMLQGEIGEYFSKVMAEKRSALPDGAHVAASKQIGWEK